MYFSRNSKSSTWFKYMLMLYVRLEIVRTMYLWVILKDEVILAQLSINPLKNIGFRVGVICQISRDLWVSREFSFPPSFSPFLFLLQRVSWWLRWETVCLWPSWGGRGVHSYLGPWRFGISFSAGSPSLLGATSRWSEGGPGQGGRGPWPWSPMGWGTFAVSTWVDSLPSVCNLNPVRAHEGLLGSFSGVSVQKIPHCWGQLSPLLLPLKYNMFQRRKQVAKRENMKMAMAHCNLELNNKYSRCWVISIKQKYRQKNLIFYFSSCLPQLKSRYENHYWNLNHKLLSRRSAPPIYLHSSLPCV